MPNVIFRNFDVNLEAQELEGHGSLRSRFAAAASRYWEQKL